jgi:hypothetical protein
MILSLSEEGREVADDQAIDHESFLSLMFDTVLVFVQVRQHVDINFCHLAEKRLAD